MPTIQNWSCHNCSGCCRQHVIEVSEEEQQRIEAQKWSATDGIPDGRPVLEPLGSRYRLAHQEDGACIFLDDKGLCRIHAKFGEAAKPLACRIYPYAFHPAGGRLAVSLRFSCPSVVRNLGEPVSKQGRALKAMTRDAVPEEAGRIPPPVVHSGQRMSWSTFTAWYARSMKRWQSPTYRCC